MADAKETADEFMDNVKSLKGWDLYGAIGAAVAVIGCFLPFATVSAFGFSASASFTDGGEGWLTLIAALVGGALLVLKKPLFALIALGVAAFIFIINFFDVLGTEGVSIGLGAFLILAGLAVALYTAITSFLASRKA